MTQILDSLPADFADRILCCYINDDRKIKIARIIDIPNWYFERVIFPGERILFEALSEAQLEVYTMVYSTVALVEIIACDRLRVKNSHSLLLVEVADDRSIAPQSLVRVAGSL